MKKLILATVFMSMSACVLAKEPFNYGIGMCEYSYSGASDSVMYSVKNAQTMSDSVYKQQDQYCSSPENIAKAEGELKKWKALPEESHPQYAPQPKDENFNRGLDIYNACIAGANVDGGALAKIVGKYSGKPSDINKIRKAYNYGSVVARGPRDCTNYTMGY